MAARRFSQSHNGSLLSESRVFPYLRIHFRSYYVLRCALIGVSGVSTLAFETDLSV